MFHDRQARQAAALVQAQHHWEKEHRLPKEAEPAWTVAISREAGANGARIAQHVGDKLGWPVYDRAIIKHIAEDHGLRLKLLESVDEKKKHWLHECVESFSQAPSVSSSAFAHCLVETLNSLSQHGNCVIVGRGAPQFLPPAVTLRVRIIAPLEDRIKSISVRHDINHEEAAAWVSKTDRERNRFVTDHFHKDSNDPHQYDLMLDSSRFSLTECAEMIVVGLKAAQTTKRRKKSNAECA